jgi:hypothetical protein
MVNRYVLGRGWIQLFSKKETEKEEIQDTFSEEISNSASWRTSALLR